MRSAEGKAAAREWVTKQLIGGHALSLQQRLIDKGYSCTPEEMQKFGGDLVRSEQ